MQTIISSLNIDLTELVLTLAFTSTGNTFINGNPTACYIVSGINNSNLVSDPVKCEYVAARTLFKITGFNTLTSSAKIIIAATL